VLVNIGLLIKDPSSNCTTLPKPRASFRAFAEKILFLLKAKSLVFMAYFSLRKSN
jgi:hypothetical protein